MRVSRKEAKNSNDRRTKPHRWLHRAQVRLEGRRIFLGHHASEDEAALVRDEFIAWFGLHEERKVAPPVTKKLGEGEDPSQVHTRTVRNTPNFPEDLKDALLRAAEKWVTSVDDAVKVELPYTTSAVQHALDLGLQPATSTADAKEALSGKGVRAVTVQEIKGLLERHNAAQKEAAARRKEQGPAKAKAAAAKRPATEPPPPPAAGTEGDAAAAAAAIAAVPMANGAGDAALPPAKRLKAMNGGDVAVPAVKPPQQV